MRKKLRTSANFFLDMVVRPRVGVFRTTLSKFRLCGYAGLVVGASLCFALTLQLGLSLWMMLTLVLCAALSSSVLAVATKVLTGDERLVFYHHMIFITAACGVVLWELGGPVRAGLDVCALGMGAFHVCGRVGCLFAGCCYGKPHGWGVSYGEEHAVNGFPAYLIGVRLVPIQAVESLWILCVVLVGNILLFNGGRPGEAFSWYILAYATGRFFLEFARGDVERPYLWSFSEAQWTSLLLVCALALSELSGLLVFHTWHAAGAGVIGITMIVLAVKRRFVKAQVHKLLLPRHIREIALAIDALPENNKASQVSVERTSLGLLISSSLIRTQSGVIRHYTLSARNKELSDDSAKTIAGLLLRLRPSAASNELIRGGQGVFHLIIHAQE